METPGSVYHQLLSHYSTQGWWPLEYTTEGPAYFDHRGTRPSNAAQQFEIVIGAILTQNTRWSNVRLALGQLAQKGLMNPVSIAKTPKDTLAQTIRSAGYSNQKAQYLHNISAFLAQVPFEKLSAMEGEEARELLLEVKGIGPETADCILLYALRFPFFVIDAYTRRIFQSLGHPDTTASYDRFAQSITAQFPAETQTYQEFHALLVAHGKTFYSKKPYPTLDPVLRSR